MVVWDWCSLNCLIKCVLTEVSKQSCKQLRLGTIVSGNKQILCTYYECTIATFINGSQRKCVLPIVQSCVKMPSGVRDIVFHYFRLFLSQKEFLLSSSSVFLTVPDHLILFWPTVEVLSSKPAFSTNLVYICFFHIV